MKFLVFFVATYKFSQNSSILRIKKLLTEGMQADFEKDDIKNFKFSLFFIYSTNQMNLLNFLNNISQNLREDTSALLSLNRYNFENTFDKGLSSENFRKEIMSHIFFEAQQKSPLIKKPVEIKEYCRALESSLQCKNLTKKIDRPRILSLIDPHISSTHYEIICRYYEHILEKRIKGKSNFVSQIANLAQLSVFKKTDLPNNDEMFKDYTNCCKSMISDLEIIDLDCFIRYKEGSKETRKEIILFYLKNAQTALSTEISEISKNKKLIKSLNQFLQTFFEMMINIDRFVIVTITKSKEIHSKIHEIFDLKRINDIYNLYYTIFDIRLAIETEENSLRTKIFFILKDENLLEHYLLIGYIIINNSMVYIKTLWSSFYNETDSELGRAARNAFFRNQMITSKPRTNIISTICNDYENTLWSKAHYDVFFKISPLIDAFYTSSNIDALAIHSKCFYFKKQVFLQDFQGVVREMFNSLSKKGIIASILSIFVRHFFYFQSTGYNNDNYYSNTNYLGYLVLQENTLRRALLKRKYLDTFLIFSGTLIITHEDMETTSMRVSIIIYSHRIATIINNIEILLKTNLEISELASSFVSQQEILGEEAGNIHFYSVMNQKLYDLLTISVKNIRLENQKTFKITKIIEYCTLNYLWLIGKIPYNQRHEISLHFFEKITISIKKCHFYLEKIRSNFDFDSILNHELQRSDLFFCFYPLEGSNYEKSERFYEGLNILD